jgi:alpha-glucosidase
MSFLKVLLVFVSFISFNAKAQKKLADVHSPNRKLKVEVLTNNAGEVFYKVYHSDSLVLLNSRLGIIRKDADFSKGLQLKSISSQKKVDDQYTLLHGKKKLINYRAQLRKFSFINTDGKLMEIVFQVSNDGLAFRYVFLDNKEKNTVFYVTKELSAFHFKTTATAILQANMDSKTGWNKTQPSYEEQYQQAINVGTSAPQKAGWVLPALFKSGNFWISITEAAVDTNYCGSRLDQFSPDANYTIAFPQVTEGIGKEAVYPESYLPWYTPWRIITLSNKLSVLAESTLGTDLALPAKYDVSSWLKPGKASWSWIMYKDGSINYNMQKRYIDFAASMNWQYCLIDVNWDRRIGYDRIDTLAKYAATKNVQLILWYNSAGDWNTVNFYTPRNKMLTHESRVTEFKKLKEMGIAGIKVDFFPGDGQSAMKYYIDILKDAAAYNIAVNFHGSTYPRGWSRTYPNLVSMESIKGEEFVTFNQQDANMQPVHCATIPFTRNLFDPMDFTPVNLSGIPGIKRKTTKGFELSLSVLFLSGIQHFAESDSGMLKQKDFAIDFLKQLPDSWDDVKFIDGYPGKYVVLARRSGENWYISAINGENKELLLEMDLSFIDQKYRNAYIITDDSTTDELVYNKFSIEKLSKLMMKPYGGFVIKVESK